VEQDFLKSLGFLESSTTFEWSWHAAKDREADDNKAVLQAALDLLTTVKNGQAPPPPPNQPQPDNACVTPPPKLVAASPLRSTPQPRAALGGASESPHARTNSPARPAVTPTLTPGRAEAGGQEGEGLSVTLPADHDGAASAIGQGVRTPPGATTATARSHQRVSPSSSTGGPPPYPESFMEVGLGSGMMLLLMMSYRRITILCGVWGI
jgi:hypothetical protein